ncbi:tape measure protein [Tenacibaculum sp.]|uniref:tape measure protein n=1 Tax=Tenacibaculum sp. TaxID=1906242 RepID=UPI003D0B8A8A
MAKNPITTLEEGYRLLDELQKKLVGVNTNLLEISKSARNTNLKDYFNAKAPNDVNEKLKLQKTILDQLNAELKERERLERALQNQLAKNKLAESDLAKELAKQRFETQQRNKEIKASAILSSKLSTEYQKLVVRMNQAGNAVQNLTAKQAQGVRLSNQEQKELKQSQAEFTKYRNAVVKADASIGRFQRNVGNYQSAIGKAGLALRNFAGTFGVLSAGVIAKEIFELTKEIDGLDKALKQVTETQEGFNQAQEFIKNVSEEAGVGVNELQKAYTKFFAAAKTTNLTLEETQDIFRQTAKAGAVLGLSTDDINGSLRALEQILSKGKVQAEEIRGQLGERLPGAFQILAKSMGLTTAELSKQLELGNVLSDDVLPGFARELEKAYNLDTVDRVQTLTAAQNRLSNSWVNIVRTTTEGGAATNFIIGIFEGLSRQINRISEGITVFNDGFVILKKGVRDFLNPINDLIAKIPILNNLFSGSLGLLKNLYNAFTTPGITVFGNAIKIAGGLLSGFGAAIQETRTQVVNFVRTLASVGDIEFNPLKPLQTFASAKNVLSNIGNQFFEGGKSVGDAFKNGFKDALKKINKESEEIIENNDSLIDLILSKTEDYSREQLLKKTKSELLEIIKELNKVRGDEKKILENSVDAYQKLISQLEDERDRLATNTAEYAKYNEKVEEAKKNLDELKNGIQGVNVLESLGKTIDFNIIGSIDLQDEIDAFENVEKAKRKIAEETAEFRKELEQNLAYSLVDLTNALFDAKVQRYEDDINRNNDYYAALLDNERLSQEQRDALEAERDRKNLELEKKKRDEQKKQAIFNKAVALGEIAINTAIGVSKSLAQGGGLFGPGLAALVIALGAVQAATVIATPIPRYKDGKEKGKGKDSIALLNDGGRDELKISEDGTMERITGRNVLGYVKKSDTIVPDANKYLSNLSDKELYENLHKHTILASMAHQSQTINSLLIANSMDKSFEKHTNKIVKALDKNKPKINLYNNNSIGEDIKFLLKFNNTL